MTNSPARKSAWVARFRVRLLLAMMLVVSAITAAGLYFARKRLATEVQNDLRREFEGELAARQKIHEVRHAALAEICRTLVRKPRIHAAIEDNALDLLYPSARDELRDVMRRDRVGSDPGEPRALQAVFHRFLDQRGAVIPASNEQDAGTVDPADEARLALARLPRDEVVAFLPWKDRDGRESIVEVMIMPIISTETDEVIASLVLGFPAAPTGTRRGDLGIRSGLWVEGRFHLASPGQPAEAMLVREISRVVASADRPEASMPVRLEGQPHLLFYRCLNPGSSFPPAYEVGVYPLAGLVARQRQLHWQVGGAGLVLLAAGLVASHFFAKRLSAPVERLAVDSEENRQQRERAEAELELSHEGLKRAVRFSADASHQLKTPVTVLRAGLEELLTRESLPPRSREEIAELIHQTYRLATVIDDLLLLSRMDAGRLQIEFVPVDLVPLIEALLDDLDAVPDAMQLTVESDIPQKLFVAGDRRYTTIILQNLLENARKYNRPGGRIRVAAREQGGEVVLTIGNSGRSIPAAMQEHIFERFHRGAIGENIPGHGLGLNLARELARIHEGDLRLAVSGDDWTEFEARWRGARSLAAATAP